jgi:S1-C subfamily serine protease
MDHAIEREEDIAVTTKDGRRLAASIAGRDASTNLAVLQVPDLDLEPLRPASSVRPGQLVLAVGRTPDGRGLSTVTTIQSTGGSLRSWRGLALDETLRTDGGFGSHFAGTPLVNGRGELVAIVTAGELRNAGITLTAPYALSLAGTIAREGRVPRAYLGVQCQRVAVPDRQRADSAVNRGLLIAAVVCDSAADRGGLLVGDIVIAFAGQPVAEPEQLHTLLARETVGESRPVEVIRGTARVTLNVTIAQRA